MHKAVVITVSDSTARGEREDLSGPAVAETLRKAGFDVIGCETVPDEIAPIKKALTDACAVAAMVVTTGGTGLAARDVTPEATRAVCDRLAEGVAEHMRSEGMKRTPFAALSRGVCGIRGSSLILNLPGSPKGAVESLEAVLILLSHALELLAGNTSHACQQDS